MPPNYLSNIKHRPDLSRATDDPIPPWGSKITGLLPLPGGVWCLRQNWIDLPFTVDLALNSFVFTLRSGGLLVYNPVACTAEAAALFDSIPGSARVEHVVLPSLLADHWYHTPGWADRFAGATIWTAPGLLECAFPATIVGGKERVQQLLASFPPGAVRTMPMTGPLPGLDGQVLTAHYQDPLGLFLESAVFVADYGAALFGDMAFGVYEHKLPWVFQQSSKVSGIYRQLGCTFVRPVMEQNPQVAGPWAAEVLGWGAARVFGSHLDPEIPNGGEELVRCFGPFAAKAPAA